MFFSLTGLVYLILFLALGLLTYRFFQYWKQKKDTTSKMLVFFVATLLSFSLVRVITSFFFLDNVKIIILSMAVVAFFEGLAAAFSVYLITYLKFPKISPQLIFGIFFMFALLIAVFGINIPYHPTIKQWGMIDWGFPGGTFGNFYIILRTLILTISFAALIIILIQQFKESPDAFVRRRAMGLSVVLSIAILVGFIDFFLNSVLGANIIYRDITLGFCSILLFIVIFVTQKSPLSQLE